jgi:hypothetical protein
VHQYSKERGSSGLHQTSWYFRSTIIGSDAECGEHVHILKPSAGSAGAFLEVG